MPAVPCAGSCADLGCAGPGGEVRKRRCGRQMERSAFQCPVQLGTTFQDIGFRNWFWKVYLIFCDVCPVEACISVIFNSLTEQAAFTHSGFSPLWWSRWNAHLQLLPILTQGTRQVPVVLFVYICLLLFISVCSMWLLSFPVFEVYLYSSLVVSFFFFYLN